MKRQFVHKLFFATAFGVLIFALPVLAQNVGGVDAANFSAQTGLGVRDPKAIIASIINIALGFLSTLAVLMILYGGFRYMTANGVEENVQKAKRTITQAVIGLTIILFSWAITVFLLNAIGGATGALDQGSTTGTTGGSLGGGGTTRQFLVTSFSPSGTLPIRPSEVDVSFNSPVDSATLAGNVTVTAGGVAVPGTLSANGSVVSFVPDEACPAPNETHKCLPADTEFTITATTGLKSETGLVLNCGALSAPCVGTFKSGNQVDFDPPTGRYLQPLDGAQFNASEGFLMKVEALDNVAASRVEFTVDGASAGSAAVSGSSAQLNYTQTVTVGTILTLGGKIFDFGSNQAPILNSPKVIARAAHCFNQAKDEDETGIDCGGAVCGVCAGGSCTQNLDCASGVCQNGICVERPTIADVQLRDGAPGNFITITGANFGNSGSVVFLNGPADDDDKIAPLACSGAWSDESVIVQIPVGAIDGPIKLVNNLNLSDTTEAGGRGLEMNFDVNEVKRPGLCSAQPSSGSVGQGLTFNGGGLGTEATAKIGNVSTTVQNASSTSLDSSIPALEDGTHDAVITVAAEPSNPLPIVVKEPEPAPAPTIADVSPATGGPGTTITITGTNFGTAGAVRFTLGDKIALGDTSFPVQCGTSFWSPNSIRVKIPKQFSDKSVVSPGTFSMVVERSSGTRGISAAQDFVVNSDPAGPGLCALDPVAGPENIAVKLLGEGFGTVMGSIKFGALAAVPADTVWSAGDVQTKVPADAISAPVKLATAAGAESNGIFFTVGNCRAGDLSCPEGTQCCENGSCSSTCSVRVTDSNYAWRFSTGRLPRPPKLLAQCGRYPDKTLMMPSPAPLLDRAGGNQVCPNAKVTAVFDTILEPSSIHLDTLQIFCDDTTNTACGPDRLVPGTSSIFDADPKNTDTTLQNALDFIPTNGWQPGKYRIEVKKSISSASTSNYLAAEAKANPACDRPGANDIAFCWKFEAGTQACKIASYAVLPSSPTIDEPYDALRPLAKPDGSAIQLVATPLAQDELCLALSTAGQTFTWESADATKVDVKSTSQTSSNALALLGGVKETGDSPVKVRVTSDGVFGYSFVGVLFGRPTVVRHEPDCEGACINAAIRAVFSTRMDQPTVQMKLWRCKDANCDPETRVGAEIPLTPTFSTDTNNPNQDIATANPTLEKSAYYRVLIPARSGTTDCLGCSTAGISLAERGVNYRVPRTGGEDLYYSWIFKTKADGTPCQINVVNIEPATAKVNRIGATAPYLAAPRSAPDDCNKDGQVLNASLSSWNWSLTPANGIGEFVNALGAGVKSTSGSVTASGVTTHLSGITAGYTGSCLRAGSDATFGGTASCGNNNWEASLGEGCDDGNVANGDGCSDHCQPEGITTRNVDWNRSSVSGNCGDGRVQNSAQTGTGEQCDDGNTDETDQCNSRCLWTGNSLGTCGNGKLEPGEACDDGNADSGDGCSNRCLFEGSASNVILCGDRVRNSVKEDCDRVGDGAVGWPNGLCNPQTCLWRGTSAPTCGNNVIDPGEQCDDRNTVSGDGCSEKCLLEGSGANYASASFCGDGTVGSGEADGSEAAGVVHNLIDPGQVVRATTNLSSIANIETYPTQAARVTGTASFQVTTNVCDACVLDVAPSCTATGGDTACTQAGGGCQSTVSGTLCVVPNASTSESCSALRGRCIVQSPELLVRCGSNAQPVALLPSPAPLVDQANALNPQDGMCKNALISGAFNQSMDEASLRAGVEVYDCGASAIDADCTRASRVTISNPNFVIDSEGAATNSRFKISPATSWTPDHVYVVVVRTSVKNVGGKNALSGKHYGRDCGPVTDNIHSCFRFRAADIECPPSRVAVAVSPSLVTNAVQGVVATADVLAERCVAISNRGILFAWNALKYGVTPEAAADNVVFNPPNPTGSTSTLSATRDGKDSIRASIAQTPLIRGEQTLTVQLEPEECPDGQGTGYDGLCHDRPGIDNGADRTSPGANDGMANPICEGVPRNAAIVVVFDKPMDESTLLIPGAMTVQGEGNCASAPTSVMDRFMKGFKNLFSSLRAKPALASDSTSPSSLSYCGVPLAGSIRVIKENDQAMGIVFDSTLPLGSIKWYRVNLSGALRSFEGAGLVDNNASYTYYFRSADKLAPITEVRICDSIDPSCTGDSTQGLVGTITNPSNPQREFLSFARGQVCAGSDLYSLAPKPGLFEWAWAVEGASAWSPETGTPNVQIAVDQRSTESENPSRGLVKATSKEAPLSRGVIAASASITVNTLPENEFANISGRAVAIGETKTGTTPVTIMPCRNPWPSTGTSPWTDPATNFSFFYCRDGKDGSLMPALNAVPVTTPQTGIFKEFLFMQPTGLQSKIPGLAKKLAYANTGPAFSMVDVGTVQNTEKKTVAIPELHSKLAALSLSSVTPNTASTGSAYNISSINGTGFQRGWSSETGMVAYWPLDTISGGFATDVVSGNKAPAVKGQTTAGVVGQAFSTLNSSTGLSEGYVSANNTPALSFTGNQVTLAAWVVRRSAPFVPWETIAAKGSTSYRLNLCGLKGSCLPNSALNSFAFGLFGSVDVDSGVVPVANTPYFVVGVYDGTKQMIYVNGVLRASMPQSGNFAINPSTFDIGQNSKIAGRNWQGLVDEVRLYNRALTPAEIAELYKAKANGVIAFTSSRNQTATCSGTVYSSSTTLSGGTCNFSPLAPGPMKITITNPDGSAQTFSNAINLVDTNPPTAPVLSGLANGIFSTSLSWTTSIDNDAVTGYQIERCQGAGCAFASIGTVGGSVLSLSDPISAGNVYSYRVKATDAAGNASAYSNTVTVTIPALIDTPGPIVFAPATNVTKSTVIESNAVTITAINAPVNVSVVAGEYQLNGGAWTNVSGPINLNDSVKVRHTSSATDGGSTTTTLTVGTLSSTFTSTVIIPIDTTPSAFSFGSALVEQPLSSLIVSPAVMILGINAPANISIVGGEYQINKGTWTTIAGTVNFKDQVNVRHTTANSMATRTTTTLTVDTVSASFISTTIVPDTTPDPFTFAAVTGAPLNTVQVSQPMTISGVNTPVTISVTGGEYSMSGSNVWFPPGRPNSTVNGKSILVRHTSSSSYSTPVTTTLTVGSERANFVSTTIPEPPDTTPDPISFTEVTGAALNVRVQSNSVNVAGINVPTDISILNGEYSVAGSAFTSQPGKKINPGDALLIRHISSSVYSTTTTTTLTLGTLTTTMKSTTIPEPVDNTPPQTTILSPTDAATVAGTVLIVVGVMDESAAVNVSARVTCGTITPASVTVPTTPLTDALANLTWNLEAGTRCAAGNTALTILARDTARTPNTTEIVRNLTVALIDRTAPSVAQNLRQGLTTAGETLLSWDAATDSVGVTGYTIERCQGRICTEFLPIAESASTSYTDRGLTPGTDYRYRIIAHDAAHNNSAASTPIPVTTAASRAVVVVTWKTSTDNVGVDHYEIERCPGVGCNNFDMVGRVTGLSYSDYSVQPESTYGYRIVAVDAALNRSAPSRVITVLVPGIAPSSIPSPSPTPTPTPTLIPIPTPTPIPTPAPTPFVPPALPSPVIPRMPALPPPPPPTGMTNAPKRVAHLFHPPNILVRLAVADTEPPTAPGEPAVLPTAPVPEISTLNPAGQPQGAEAFTLTVQGTNFADRSVVLLDGKAVDTKFVTSGILEASVPSQALTDLKNISVTVFSSEPGGGTTSALTFKVGKPTNPVPGFSSISPSSVVKLQTVTMTISGGGFAQGVTTLRFDDGIIVRKLKVMASDRIEAEIFVTPQAAEGSRAVIVKNLAPGGGTSQPGAFSIENPSPVFEAVTPTQVLSGSPIATLRLRGKNFVNSSSVQINSVAKTSADVTVLSDTELTVKLNADDLALARELSLVVANGEPGGGLSTAKKVVVGPNPVPVLTALSPNRVIAGPEGFVMSLTGTGFSETSRILGWGEGEKVPVFVSDTQLVLAVPAGEAVTAGNKQIVVRNPAPGGGDSEAVNFLIKPYVPGDVIGVRILPNPDRLSAMDWYKSKGYPGNPVVMTIDGYDAVLDGRTLYVNAMNFSLDASKSITYPIFSNIYVISYNLDAGPEMKLIHEGVMKSLMFNENLIKESSNNGFCRVSAASDSAYLFKQGKLLPCSSDLDCSTVKDLAVCASEKAKFQRDQKRLSDFYGFSGSVLSKVRGGVVSVPQIESGSFLKSFSTSAWPSWQRTLGSSVGAVPSDPLNKFTVCKKICSKATTKACPLGNECGPSEGACIPDSNYEQATCWDGETVQFICPAGSHVYTYQSLGQSTANFSLEFESQAMANFPIGVCELSSPTPGKRCRNLGQQDAICGVVLGATMHLCLNARGTTSASPVKLLTNSVCANSAFGSTSVCGDGVIGNLPNGTPETCEKGQAGPLATCGIGGTRTQQTTCNDTCTGFVNSGSCQAPLCGNGKVDTYTACSNNHEVRCLPTVGSSGQCGSGTCQEIREVCDDGADNGRYGFCSVNCTLTGKTFCGDNILQPGEECDLGGQNGVYQSGCSVDCKRPGLKCGDQVLTSPEACELGEVRSSDGGRACSNDISKSCTANEQCSGGTCLVVCGLTTDGRAQTRRQQCASSCLSWNPSECVSGKCGDGITATDKKCSNANTACTKDADCATGGACLPVEQCDDGNKNDNDACTTQCKLNYCGDGFTNAGIEECDDGDRNGSECDPAYGGVCNYCSNTCKVRTVSGAICGNGAKEKGEVCDGKDFGGKYCLGGIDEGRSCANDNECTGNGKCVAQYCVGGLKCELFKAATNWPATEANPFDPAKKIKDFVAPSLDLENNVGWGRGYCTNDELVRCWDYNGGHNDRCASGQNCVQTAAQSITDVGKLYTPAIANFDDFMVRCSGYVRPHYSGTYTFGTVTDDGIKFYVNNQLLINSWAEQSAQVARPTSLTLEANRWYPIKVEHYEHGGAQVVRVAWKNIGETGGAFRIIGGNVLSSLPEGDLTSGLTCPEMGVCTGSGTVTISNIDHSCGNDGDCGDNGKCVPADGGMCKGGANDSHGCKLSDSESCPNGICETPKICEIGSTTYPNAGQFCMDNSQSQCGSGTVCSINAGTRTSSMRGICIGGSTADGTECNRDSGCGAGGVCSFVPGKCLDVNNDLTSTSCVADTDCAPYMCARGVCNGGSANGKACASSTSCSGGSCVFSRCEQACGASCPTNNQSTSLQFRVIGTGSKCSGGDSKRVGGGCSNESDCYGSCNNDLLCTPDTRCETSPTSSFYGKCVPRSATCSSGFKLPTGMCALCAPTSTPAASLSLGRALNCTSNSDCGSGYTCDATEHLCVCNADADCGTGGVCSQVQGVCYKSNGDSAGNTCTSNTDCLVTGQCNSNEKCVYGGTVSATQCSSNSECNIQNTCRNARKLCTKGGQYPKNAWLVVPACRALTGVTSNIDKNVKIKLGVVPLQALDIINAGFDRVFPDLRYVGCSQSGETIVPIEATDIGNEKVTISNLRASYCPVGR